MTEQEIDCKVVKLDNKTLIKRWFFNDIGQMEMKPPWCGGYLTQCVRLLIHGISSKHGNLKNIFKSFLMIFESHQPHQKDKTRKFQNVIRKRFLGDIYWNPQNIRTVKCFFVSN